ncbi:hypothetical protein Tco_0841856 [Tanacetum coccineum]|uniref:Uncharacterized protein n=1 Tax=Tanacetum coccineum TaxID=301880 RepID=A0ABQ5B1Z9_9ASTR
MIIEKQLVLEMLVDESLEMIVDESLDMIVDESLDMIMDESLMVEDKSLEKLVDETLKLDEKHYESDFTKSRRNREAMINRCEIVVVVDVEELELLLTNNERK